jgi:Nif-specific regulatory protein
MERLASVASADAEMKGVLVANRQRLASLQIALERQGDMLRAVAEVTGEEEDSIGVALGSLMNLTHAQRGFIVLRARDGALSFPAARTFAAVDLDQPEGHISRSILRAALHGSSTVAVADALADERFASHGSVKALALRAVLAVPIVTRGETWGAIYLDNPLRAGAFSAEACRSVEQFARIIAPILERDIALKEVDREHDERARKLRVEHDFSDIVGQSDALLEVLTALARIAPTEAVVLIEGETGTGKELLARKIHALSRRAARPFVAINCGALPRELIESELFGHERGAFTGAHGLRLGRFEAANAGTLFLDEVGELSAEAQAKLLRVLSDGTFQRVGSSETRTANVRVIAATNRELTAEVAAGRFRQDLLYRLNVIRLKAPALRERDGDVPLLAHHFLTHFAAEHARPLKRLRPDAIAALEASSWPGNVRELANVIERGVIMSSESETELALERLDLQPRALSLDATDMKSAVKAYKRRLVERALDASEGNNAAAARLLGVHPKYLYQLLRELEVPASSSGPPSARKSITPVPGSTRKKER